MERVQKTTFGAFRWDAWYKSNNSPEDTGSQCLKALSPKHYHWRAPFFAEVTADGKIDIPAYNQEIFDKEMEYAIEAGIDYFSYVWYSHSGLRQARDFHKKSKYRDKVTLCACLDNNGITKDYAREELVELFKEDYYTKIDNRPLVYFFGAMWIYERIKEDIVFYNDACKKNNIPQPYYVIMGVSPENAYLAGGHAVSRYSVSGSDNIPFNKLCESVYDIWERHSKEGEEFGVDNVLPLVAGFHPHPRYENPVTWMKVEENNYAEYATADEIKEHFACAKRFLSDERYFSTTKSNTCILYAWNEHDEGGWICPTLKVDENGDQLYDESGNKLIDDSRIKALKEVLRG